MHLLILVAGFVGAWLLFAGPVYQASIELGEESLERGRLAEAAREIGEPVRVSAWWWLLPPVAYYLQRRRQRAFQREVALRLSPEEFEVLLGFMNKATGWLLVAAGAVLIAAKETYELLEELEWPLWSFWAVCVGLIVVSTLYTVERTRRTHDMQARFGAKAVKR